jgi:hypothetical protein
VRYQTKPLRLKRDRTSTGKWVDNNRGITTTGSEDLLASGRQNSVIVGVVPQDKLFKNSEKSEALGILSFLARKFLWMSRRVINELGEEYRPAGS